MYSSMPIIHNIRDIVVITVLFHLLYLIRPSECQDFRLVGNVDGLHDTVTGKTPKECFEQCYLDAKCKAFAFVHKVQHCIQFRGKIWKNAIIYRASSPTDEKYTHYLRIGHEAELDTPYSFEDDGMYKEDEYETEPGTITFSPSLTVPTTPAETTTVDETTTGDETTTPAETTTVAEATTETTPTSSSETSETTETSETSEPETTTTAAATTTEDCPTTEWFPTSLNVKEFTDLYIDNCKINVVRTFKSFYAFTSSMDETELKMTLEDGTTVTGHSFVISCDQSLKQWVYDNKEGTRKRVDDLKCY